MAETRLREAGDYIREHGFIKEALGRDGGPRCAVGAMLSAHGLPIEGLGFGMNPAIDADIIAFAAAAAEQWPERLRTHVLAELYNGTGRDWSWDDDDVAEFNDHGFTTVDDVLLAFEKAAVRQEELVT